MKFQGTYLFWPHWISSEDETSRSLDAHLSEHGMRHWIEAVLDLCSTKCGVLEANRDVGKVGHIQCIAGAHACDGTHECLWIVVSSNHELQGNVRESLVITAGALFEQGDFPAGTEVGLISPQEDTGHILVFSVVVKHLEKVVVNLLVQSVSLLRVIDLDNADAAIDPGIHGL